MAVSLSEVALRAGVARGTVSSVLNNRANEVRISSATQTRIRRIADELGYRPNPCREKCDTGRFSNPAGWFFPLSGATVATTAGSACK